MSVTVSIPTPLRSFTGGREAVELTGSTVGEVIDGLLATHGGLKRHLVQEDGRLRNFVNLYLNDTDIRHLDSTDTPVREGDVLTIVPSIAGGRPAVETKQELPKLSHAEVLRYSRHLLLPEVGVEGQRKLKAARVLTIGAGGLIRLCQCQHSRCVRIDLGGGREDADGLVVVPQLHVAKAARHEHATAIGGRELRIALAGVAQVPERTRFVSLLCVEQAQARINLGRRAARGQVLDDTGSLA